MTITAERRTTNLQTAPVAASVIAGAQLQNEGIQTLDDLQFHTPSLTVADFGQGNLFNIRGIGKDLTNVQTPSGVVTYWDGVASFPGFFADPPYYDISNVEVLRGPQGTFAGQNATGGAVFITTNDPRLGSFSGDIEGQYGNYNDGLVRGFVNMPIGDTLAVRIAFNGERRDSFYNVAGPWTTPFGGTPGRQLLGSLRVGVTLAADRRAEDRVQGRRRLPRPRRLPRLADARPGQPDAAQPAPTRSTSARSSTTTPPTRATG